MADTPMQLLPLCVWVLVPNTRLSKDEVPGDRLAVLRGVTDAYLLSDTSMAGVMCRLEALWAEEGPPP